MSYTIIEPNQPFTQNKVFTQQKYLEKNALWQINDGEKLLVRSTGEFGFLQDIGLDHPIHRVKYAKLAPESFHQLVQYYATSGMLHAIVYDEKDDFLEEEVAYVHKLLENIQPKEPETITAFMKVYMELVDEIAGMPNSILVRDNQQLYKVYANGSFYFFSGNQIQDDFAFSIYQTHARVLQKPFSLTPIQLLEKTRIDHPLTHAHAYLEHLFAHVSDDTIEQAGISKEEAQKIQTQLLTYVKGYEGKQIYAK